MTTRPARWLSRPELADLLGVSLSWVEKQTAARTIPFHRVGARIRFTPEDVAAIERQTAQAPVSPRLRAVR